LYSHEEEPPVDQPAETEANQAVRWVNAASGLVGEDAVILTISTLDLGRRSAPTTGKSHVCARRSEPTSPPKCVGSACH